MLAAAAFAALAAMPPAPPASGDLPPQERSDLTVERSSAAATATVTALLAPRPR